MLRESRVHSEHLDPSEEVGRSKDPAQSGFYDEVLQRYSDQAILNADPKCLTATQLERRAILLAGRRSTERTGCQAASSREPRRRQPRKAGRHDTARMAAYLPEDARIDRTMTDAAIRVYSVLWRLADEGRDDPSVRELAGRALCDVRTAQFAIAALKLSGHLMVVYRPRRPRMSQTNVYHLAHHRGTPSTSSTRDEKPRGVKNLCTLLRDKESVVTTSRDHEGCSWNRSAPGRHAESDHKIASFEGSARKVQAIPRKAPSPARRQVGFDAEARRLAIVSLEAQGIGDKLDTHDCEAICAAVDRLRRQRFPGFSAYLWEKSVNRLGFRAYLAVIEVVEMSAVKRINDMTAYLGGILRKPSDEVRPDVTLARLQYSAAA